MCMREWVSIQPLMKALLAVNIAKPCSLNAWSRIMGRNAPACMGSTPS